VNRREIITLIGGASAWPVVARAQQTAMPLIGFLHSSSPDLYAHLVRAFGEGLGEAGYIEGRNVEIEYRWAQGRDDLLPALAADLVRLKVAMIAAPGSNPAIFAAKAATTTIPIVFLTGTDPVRSGLVTSLNRPGGHLTGVSTLTAELASKFLELTHEAVPTARTIALLVNPANRTLAESTTKDMQAAARTLGLQFHVLHAISERDFDNVFANLVRLRAGALIIGTDPLTISWIEKLATLTVRHAVPAIFQYREFAATGGLMSYGGSLTDLWRLSGVYAGRILKGEKAADMPVQQVTKVGLVINLKTAKALGISVPPTLLARADEVIE
jgi:putative ABC transport system substrate-binding protein